MGGILQCTNKMHPAVAAVAVINFVVSLASAEVPTVLPLKPAAPYSQQAFYNASLWSWGGSVIEDDSSTYHIYAASFVNGCGLSAWETNSQVHHGVSTNPLGPFIFHDVAIPVWHHNPQVVRAPDGTYIIYSIGMSPEGKVHNCGANGDDAGDIVAAPDAHGAEIIEAHYSRSPNGPWAELNITGAKYSGRNLFDGTNPTPWVLANGTVIVGSHQGKPSEFVSAVHA